jgi:hypothetical protein
MKKSENMLVWLRKMVLAVHICTLLLRPVTAVFFIGEISTVFTFYHDWKFFPFLGLEMAMVSQQLQASSAS